MALRNLIVILFVSFLSLTFASAESISQAVSEGHNDESCKELPTGEGEDAAEQLDLTKMDEQEGEHKWKDEWTNQVFSCLDQHGQDLLKDDLPDDYKEFCGGPIRQHVEADKKLFLLSVFIAMAKYESNFDPETQADIEAFKAQGLAVGENQSNDDPPTGLYQMGKGDCPDGGSCDMKDPNVAICAAVKKANDQVKEDKVFAGCKNEDKKTCKGEGWGGFSAYWEPMRTMETNDAGFKANAIKNAVRGVCACGNTNASGGGSRGGFFSELPEEWKMAARGSSANIDRAGVASQQRFTPFSGRGLRR